MTRIAGVVLALATVGASWVDPHATAREAARLYAEGKFADATAKYREALVDDPDSPLLHFNAGAAAYRDGKFDDAVAALGAIPPSDADAARTARTAYNVGNAKYRQGATAEASNPQQALTRWAEALVAYRRAMGADPTDEDPKFNYEFVEKKIADLKKKLEQQQKDKQQQQQQQKDQQQQQADQQRQPDQQQQDHQDQQNGEQQNQPDQQEQQQQQAEAQQGGQRAEDQNGGQDEQQKAAQEAPNDQHGEPAGGGGDAVAGGEKTDQMSPREAQAILDGQRDQEVRPDEIVKRLQNARVAEPGEDW